MSTYFLYILHFIYKNTIFGGREHHYVCLKHVFQYLTDAFREIIEAVFLKDDWLLVSAAAILYTRGADRKSSYRQLCWVLKSRESGSRSRL